MNPSPSTERPPLVAESDRKLVYCFWGLLLLALAVRLFLILTTTYLWDEDREWIPLARSIVFTGEHANLPWRSILHTATTAYLSKAGELLLGQTALGYRLAFALCGTASIWAVGQLAREWLGLRAALISVLFLTVNEYHMGISTFVMEKTPYLMCAALALLHFARFLRHERSRHLYFAAAFSGAAMQIKETAVLLAPVFFLTIVAAGRLALIKKKEPYVAAGVAGLFLVPDLIWNLFHFKEGLGVHSGRIAGIGLNPYYILFFARDWTKAALRALGRHVSDAAAEYPAQNAFLGILLLVAAVLAVVYWRKLDPVGRLVAISFWFVIFFFALVQTGEQRFIPGTQTPLDRHVWFWIDMVLLGGAVLVGWAATALPRPARFTTLAALAIGTLFASYHAIGGLGTPPAIVEIAPVHIWPPNNSKVTIRTYLGACQLCTPTFRLDRAEVDEGDGAGFRTATAEQVEGAQLGTADREWLVTASLHPGSNRREYRFRFTVLDGRGHSQQQERSVVVDSSISLWALPYWAQ